MAMLSSAWRTFAVFLAVSGALAITIFIAVPELDGIWYPETGSGHYSIAAPCPNAVPVTERWETLRADRDRISIRVPPGTWRRESEARPERVFRWREAASGDQVSIEVLERDPGRPRIDRGDFHGIAALERCRERIGADSVWIASAYLEGGVAQYLVAIAQYRRPDGWVRVRAITAADSPRQPQLLAAVRTAAGR
jgi:hypothetical protein